MSWLTHLFLTCQEMSGLLSDMMDHRLPWHIRLRIRVHLWMCELCNGYQHQLTLLRSLVRHKRVVPSEQESALQPELSVEAKERMRRALESYRS